MNIRAKDKKLLNSLSKEIASEITLKRRNPSYTESMDKDDCVRRLCIITGLSDTEVTKMMDEKITEYLRIGSMFR